MSKPTTTAPTFSFGVPSATTAAGSTGFSFGTPSSTTSAATAAAPSFSIGGAQAANPPAAASSFSFGSPAAAPKAQLPVTITPKLTTGVPASTVAPTATTTSSLFGAPAPAVSTQASTTLFGATTTAAVAAPSTNFSFGTTTGTSTSTGATPAFAAKTTAGQLNLTTATKTTESSTVSAPPAPTVASVSYNQMEEYINKWTLELEEQEKVFLDQASQINAWDQLLISNNQKILELNNAVQKVKAEQETLEQELDFISTQHTELEESIAPLQKEFNKIPQMDVERTQVYITVENLDTQLKQMSEDLKEVIVNLNEANKCQDNSDPIIQIGKILNAHMSSLQWIENTSSTVSAKLDDLSKMHESFKRDSERSFRSAYYN